MAGNYIELNGNRYDVNTGAYLGRAIPARVEVVRPATTTGDAEPIAHVSILEQPKHHARETHKNHVTAHRRQHAKTLRRDAVKRPDTQQKTAIRVQAPVNLTPAKPDAVTVKPKLSSETVDVNRVSRAQSVPHSPKVERFRESSMPTRVVPIAVREEPKNQPVASVRPAEPAHSVKINTQPQVAVRPQEQRAASPVVTEMVTTARTAQSVKRSDDIFERALARATSHEQTAPKTTALQKVKRTKRQHKRGLRIATSVAIVLLLGGFIFWQNRVSVNMQLAAARSGVAASMPGYRPQGFAFSNLSYSSGTVTLGFHNGGDQTKFDIVQKASNWDSQTLLTNYVATSGQPYTAYPASGRTVYIYSNGDATWVNGGVWYQINDNGVLNQDQIIKVVNSI